MEMFGAILFAVLLYVITTELSLFVARRRARPVPRRTTAAEAASGHLAIDADRHTLSGGDGGVMSKFERLLEAGSTELPDCRCAAEMNLIAIVPLSGGDTEIRIFRCPKCSHELRLTAWHTDVSAA